MLTQQGAKVVSELRHKEVMATLRSEGEVGTSQVRGCGGRKEISVWGPQNGEISRLCGFPQNRLLPEIRAVTNSD